MLISTGSRQLVLRLKKYSDKKANAIQRQRSTSSKNNANTNNNAHDDHNASAVNIETASTALTEVREDRSLLGCFLNCPPCKKVTDAHKDKTVSLSSRRFSKADGSQPTVLFVSPLQESAKKNWEDSEANLYWKYKAVEYYAKTQEADKVQEKLDNLSNR